MSAPVLVGALAASLAVALPGLAAGAALAERHRVVAAADAAALAAADTAWGLIAGAPCARAAELALLADAALADCRVSGVTVSVSLRGSVLGVPIRAAARAGPAPARGPERAGFGPKNGGAARAGPAAG